MGVNFYLPDFFYLFKLNRAIIELQKVQPESFHEGIVIKSVYGCFPPSVWNGGRVVGGFCDRDNLIITAKYFNDNGIGCRFTFTNSLIEEKHLQDTFCNLCMTLCENPLNDVVVNSPLLEQYIRERYPSYRIISSVTRWFSDPVRLDELLCRYDTVILNYLMNNTRELMELDHKERYEILVNSYCDDSCAKVAAHYESVSRAQLEYASRDTFDNGGCGHFNRTFPEIMENRSFVPAEDVLGKYREAGFRHFKISGRMSRMPDVLESYLYYLVKPQFRDRLRLRMLKELWPA
ncbi:MAG: hypothetical protein HGB04_09765 [Chlorobiaceae bacterium]|nr:hypothetical protein [Chlorobiaceae bacterium]